MRQAEIEKLHQEAVIIDGLLYGPAADSDDCFRKIKNAGVTGTNVTIPAVDDNFRRTEQAIARWKERIARCRDFLYLGLSVSDILGAKKSNKTAVIMGTQNSVHFEGNLENVGKLQKLGLRIVQLTYQEKNAFGSGCGAGNDAGLTPFGKKLVDELNRRGILIDLSHCGPRTTMEAIAASTRPCAFTHANAYSLCKHVRNKTDQAIRALAEKAGVMGIVNYAPFADIKRDRRPGLAEFLDEIEYVIKLVGVDHVGIGLDFTPAWAEEDYLRAQKQYPEIYLDYKMKEIPLQGLEDISQLFRITRGLGERGYCAEEIKKILGGNFLRVFRATWG